MPSSSRTRILSLGRESFSGVIGVDRLAAGLRGVRFAGPGA
jgi:hypothetical protein